jgi:hypothetical protein
MAENIDLAKTFTDMAGTTPFPDDGHSLLSVLHGTQPTDWRNAVLIEHHGPNLNPSDPDFQFSASGNPTTYEAMRTANFLYVEYVNGEREFYDLRTDPFELHNVVTSLPPDMLARLHLELAAMENCHSGDSCWQSEHVSDGSTIGTQFRRAGRVVSGLSRRRAHHGHRLRHRRYLDRKRRAHHRHLSTVPFGYRRHNRQAQPRARAL